MNNVWLSIQFHMIFDSKQTIYCHITSGFSFEAGGPMLRPVVFHSMPGTLISIFEGFFYYFIIIICFYLSISWIYWLEDNRILQLNYSKLPHYFFRYLPPPSPTSCPFSLNILLFKENLSELWPLLGNWYLVSSNAGNNVSECSLLKISWGSIPPDPPSSSRFKHVKGALWCQKNVMSGAFTNNQLIDQSINQ